MVPTRTSSGGCLLPPWGLCNPLRVGQVKTRQGSAEPHTADLGRRKEAPSLPEVRNNKLEEAPQAACYVTNVFEGTGARGTWDLESKTSDKMNAYNGRIVDQACVNDAAPWLRACGVRRGALCHRMSLSWSPLMYFAKQQNCMPLRMLQEIDLQNKKPGRKRPKLLERKFSKNDAKSAMNPNTMVPGSSFSRC